MEINLQKAKSHYVTETKTMSERKPIIDKNSGFKTWHPEFEYLKQIIRN